MGSPSLFGGGPEESVIVGQRPAEGVASESLPRRRPNCAGSASRGDGTAG